MVLLVVSWVAFGVTLMLYLNLRKKNHNTSQTIGSQTIGSQTIGSQTIGSQTIATALHDQEYCVSSKREAESSEAARYTQANNKATTPARSRRAPAALIERVHEPSERASRL